MNTVDIGLPQLAMHSPYETAGVKDTEYLVRAAEELFANCMGSIVAEVNGADTTVILDAMEAAGLGHDVSVIGSVNDSRNFIYKDMSLSIEEALKDWVTPLEKVFPTRATEDKDPVDTGLYQAKEIYVCKNKVAKPKVFIPVFPGTNCEYDSAKAFERAGAEPLTASEINIGAILAERARELYYEENRHVELVRISYTYAKTGRPCEVFGGRVYRLDNLSGPGGTNSNIKEEGYNFWFDWVNEKNNFYNKGVKHKFAEYKISVHHILWPVPANVINTNTMGVINQNVGYPGTENNKEPLKVPLDGSVIK